MPNQPDVPRASTLEMMAKKPSKGEAVVLQKQMMEYVVDDRFTRTVPRFMTELPYGGDNDEITDRIAAQVFFADDPDAATSKTVAAKDLVGVKGGVTIHDIRVNDGNLEGGWGAYLLMDITVGTSEDHVIANTGAKQVITRLARAWAEGALPITGAFTQIATAGASGNAPVAFIAEQPF